MPTFTTVLQRMGNNVGIEVPEDVVLAFRAGPKVPVTVVLNGFTYASTVAPTMGSYLVPVSQAVCEAAGVVGGEQHDVSIEHDTSERAPEVPDELADALEDNGLRAAFDALPLDVVKAHVRTVNESRAAAARARRVQKVVDSMR